MLNGKDTEIHNEYDSMTVEELELQFKEVFLYTDQIDDSLAEELEQICDALDKKKPLEDLDTVEEYWKRFKEFYAGDMLSIGIQDEHAQSTAPIERQHQEPKVRKVHYRAILRSALIAAIVIVLLVSVTCVAGALGFNLWGWVPIWNADELHFVPETQEPVVASTIREALQQFGIDDPLYPTWLPEGFVLTESKIDEEPLFLNECYVDANERSLSITITSVDGFGTAFYQKIDNPPQEYVVGETMHYIVDNSNNVSAIWLTEHYSVLIVGKIGIEEMQSIINSVYYEVLE